MIVAAIYLKEPVTNKKVLGIFVGAMGAFILIMSSQTTGAAMAASSETFSACSPKSASPFI